MWWGDGMMGAGVGVMVLLWLLLIGGLVAIIAAVVALATRSRGGQDAPRGPAGSQSAREVLEMRLARGEIDTAEFTERLRALEGR